MLTTALLSVRTSRNVAMGHKNEMYYNFLSRKEKIAMHFIF